ncbi:response regulator transcription factor [Diaphorobacter ruginosibacter]|jgi:DNA-binding response OmpR family regulator|uniref:Response regulator transcription factor n=1 Tax=Diaphorobacter ruginosibacter TaxID=1715720 RepID=A0A7G9RPS4_9BURK|nr:response regulator transcription factor [Diaphorobacter ruginosibacter]MDR2333180.1 response regulator transcription factor [Burkholderiaceae bacterium]QNN57599.1 response regulator transcription factor [Diaphorobacter ruginosibacter]
MLPVTLALVDDDTEYCEFLAEHLRAQGVEVQAYTDSSDLLADIAPYRFDFYVLDLMLPGVDGSELVRILRKRTQAGVLIVSGRLGPEVFAEVINAGADMYLTKPVTFEQVELAIRAVHRRIMTTAKTATAWKLDKRRSMLTAPDGQTVELSPTDLVLMECFLKAQGAVVTREQIRELLEGTSAAESDNNLHATIYRLRRRIERVTPLAVPLQSQQKVGYQFRAPLIAG